MNYIKKYQKWLDKGVMTDEIKALRDEKETEECFYKDLKFGIGGIRAIMGHGPNKLNIHTVRKNTEGYARFIKSYGDEAKSKGIVIAYDNRHYSREFALEAMIYISIFLKA